MVRQLTRRIEIIDNNFLAFVPGDALDFGVVAEALLELVGVVHRRGLSWGQRPQMRTRLGLPEPALSRVHPGVGSNPYCLGSLLGGIVISKNAI